ncbi:MAG TPA: rhomboid family intramembrane serine protease [Anaerolineales bacterium]|jgi:membrane associated rhomboid family serine protease|nr:rhomboid family intramembrane serine protease [Anaerolineales bacterium]
MNGLRLILYILGLYFAFAAGSIYIRNQPSAPPSSRKRFPLPPATVLLLLAIGIPSVLQFFFPALLSALERDYERFLQGDWWRLISPLFVQDGGVAGTVFNLIGLALVGSVAERIWNRRLLFIVFFTGGILAEIVGFLWQPIGAGNSVGNFSLAASIAVACLTRSAPKPVRILAILALGADAILLGLQDIHGAAAIFGGILALLMSRFWKERKRVLPHDG